MGFVHNYSAAPFVELDTLWVSEFLDFLYLLWFSFRCNIKNWTTK